MEKETVQQQVPMEIPSRFLAKTRLDRLGRIFFNLGITCGSFIFVALLSSVLLPLLQIFLITVTFIVMAAMVVFSMGTVLFISDSPIYKVWEFFVQTTQSKFSLETVEKLFQAVPYVCMVGLAISALSIVFLSISRQKGWVGKVVAISIFIAVMVFTLIFSFVQGGSLWQN